MCGIAAIYVHEDGAYGPAQLDACADALLSAIDHRGGDACGIHWRAGAFTRTQSAPVRAARFRTLRSAIGAGARSVILHTRYATTGDPLVSENNHPLHAEGITLVHNGVLWNDSSILRACGYKQRPATVDSIALPVLIGQAGVKPDNIADALADVEGSAAVAFTDDRIPDSLTLARGSSSPLFLIRGKRATVAASTMQAVSEGWMALHGSKRPPKQNRIIGVAEGTVLRLTGRDVKESAFLPDPGYQYRGALDASQYVPRSVVSGDDAGWVEAWRRGNVCGIPATTGDTDADADAPLDVCETCGIADAVATSYTHGRVTRVCDGCSLWAPGSVAWDAL